MPQDDPKHLPTEYDESARPKLAHPLNSNQRIVDYLFIMGHFNPQTEPGFADSQEGWGAIRYLPYSHPRIYRAIESWQRMRPRLKADSIFGPVCRQTADAEARFRCGLPDVLPRQARLPAWPEACKHELTTCHQLAPLNFTPDDHQTISDAWRYGLQMWNDVADLTLSLIDPCPTARINAQAQALGNYILAWSELATNDCSARLLQAYNSQIDWRWLLLWTTICHEIGHAIGIGHGGLGIMQPAHDPTVAALDDWDLAEVIRRYGEPTPPPPPPTPPDASWHHALVTIYDQLNNALGAYDVRPRV